MMERVLSWALALTLAVLLLIVAFQDISGPTPNAIFGMIALRSGVHLAEPYGRWVVSALQLIAVMMVVIPQTRTRGAMLALGLAFAASGRMFPFFSPLLGWLGVFLTGSDTSANALFGNLQVVTAGHLGFEPTLMAAANSVGGVVGKMISVQNIAVAAAATAMTVADQAKLFRFTLRHSIVMVTAIGIEVMLYAYLFHAR